ncbi:hypothetical protein WN943_012166 [Citrus x changshan-huyou]
MIFNNSIIEAIDFSGNNFLGHLPSTIGLYLPNLLGLHCTAASNAPLIRTNLSGIIHGRSLSLSYQIIYSLALFRIRLVLVNLVVEFLYKSGINYQVIHQAALGVPQSFGSLIGLESLDLSGNNLSGEIPRSLGELSHFNFFNVSYNGLEREIPSGGPGANFFAESF